MIKGGFFDLGTGITQIKKGSKKVAGCLGCKLDRTCKSPKMKVFGEGGKKVLLINEYPSATDDKTGKPLSGNAGKIVYDVLDDLNIDLEEDCWVVNAVFCRPPDNKPPTDQHIAECRNRLLKVIKDLDPLVVVPMGSIATKGLIQHRISGRLNKIKASDFVGKRIPDQDLKRWVCPTSDPAYLLKNNDKVLHRFFKDCLKQAFLHTDIPLTQLDTGVKTTEEVLVAIKWLKNAYKRSTIVSFDYETTGLKPHKEGHKIPCASIAYFDIEEKVFKAYGFPMFEDTTFQKCWKRLMIGSRNIKLIAHNMSFEAMWTFEKYGYWPKDWLWDTCLSAHCLNSKQKTSLKFHVFTEFGVIGYDESVDKYITTLKKGEDEKSKNSFNNVRKAPFKDLMKYCAYDSLYTLHLYHIQKKQFDDYTQVGNAFFVKGSEALTVVQHNGMRIDMDLLKIYWGRITKKIDRCLVQLKQFPEYKKWDGKSTINLGSEKDLSRLLYKVLKYELPEGCESSKTGAKALEKIGTKFTLAILPYRKFLKIRDTYMAQFKREEVDGIVRGFFNLNIAATFRSSMNSPNLQNQPVRGPEAKWVRDLVVPRKGNRLLEYDYKGVEVCLSACVHKDPQMIKYIKDETTDMHGDMSNEILLLDQESSVIEEVLKKYKKFLRGRIKNTFVFPTFYGSTTKPDERLGQTVGNITRNIWEDLPNIVKKHLKENGIKSIKQFQKHMENVEWKFWNERFEVYNQWKREVYDQYKKDGYVELLTGFRCYGPLKFTEATNYPIQGPAFHVLLNTLINSHKKVLEISGRSVIIGQVHDCLLIDCHPDDEDAVDKIVFEEGITKPMAKWDWITVPLQIEKERSAVNGTWSEMEDCGYIKGE